MLRTHYPFSVAGRDVVLIVSLFENSFCRCCSDANLEAWVLFL